MSMKRCHRTGKISYRSRTEALASLARERVSLKRVYEKTEIAAYRCPLCPRWHLTSMEQR